MGTVLSNFQKSLEKLATALKNARESAAKPKHSFGDDIYDYSEGKARYLQGSVEKAIQDLKSIVWELAELRKLDKENEPIILEILNFVGKLNKNVQLEELEKGIQKLAKLAAGLRGEVAQKASTLVFDLPTLPEEIAEDLSADLNEIRKCFDSECYRSCVVLCGRVLETALYRKYFEISGNDLLETSPGLGLGKLIAKLAEKNVKFDPGLTQQIHLVNQVRISSVHSKKEGFYPSKQQAHATILYTLDVLKKLFA